LHSVPTKASCSIFAKVADSAAAGSRSRRADGWWCALPDMDDDVLRVALPQLVPFWCVIEAEVEVVEGGEVLRGLVCTALATESLQAGREGKHGGEQAASAVNLSTEPGQGQETGGPALKPYGDLAKLAALCV
jgi:hypothetical protein